MISLALFCALNLLVSSGCLSASEESLSSSRKRETIKETTLESQSKTQAVPQTATLELAEPWQPPRNKLTWGQLINGRYYEQRYIYLSSVLEESLVDNEDLKANLDKAKEWLELERTGQVGYNNQATRAALEQFVELAKLDDDETRCSYKAYEILYKNDKATGGRSRRSLSGPGPLTRVDRLVRLASERHAKECFDVYPKRFTEVSTKLRAVNVNSFEKLREFLDKVLDCTDCVTSKARNLLNDRASEQALQLIESQSEKNAETNLRQNLIDHQHRINADRVRALAKHYIIEPCQAYVRLLGTNVYVPARFSTMFSLNRYSQEDNQYRDFLHGWLHYRMCESLVRNDQETFVRALVKKYQRALQDRKLEK